MPVECVGFDSCALSTLRRRLGLTVGPGVGRGIAPGPRFGAGLGRATGREPRAPRPKEVIEGLGVFQAQVATLAARLGRLARGPSCGW